MLFFYMVILFLVFVIQFGVSCSCLALNRSQQENLLKLTWNRMSNITRHDLENQLNCCGFMNDTENIATYVTDYSICQAPCSQTSCKTCGNVMLMHSGEALRILGGVGLFFSFTEILGVWLAVRFRNQKDPRANPSAFL
ncbi:tetraspanin-31 [Heterodontus francisci]|uniref:tetraspanin-31 n=1 Tax=Heterodontus francisci TaxID=7792 RepID=UPI00355BCB61